MLIIALACRKFGEEPIRATWQDIASGLGVSTNTLRRWARELRGLGLLRVISHFRDNGKNDRNEFDITPFVELLESADAKWQERHARQNALEARS